jgi:hypothetical protein
MILRPSKANTWIGCPGSLAFCEQNNVQERARTGTDWAALGTQAHKYAEAGILSLRWPDKYKEKADELAASLPKNIKDIADRYIQWVDEFTFGRERMFWGVERSVPLWYEPDHRGTVDFFAVDGRDLVVVDFKSGRETVLAERNPQITIYAIALYGELCSEIDVDRITIGVMQPIESREPSFWSFTIDELHAFKREITSAAIEARQPLMAGRLVPGSWCKYCPAKQNAVCPALDRQMMAEFSFGEPELLSEDKLFAVLQNIKTYKSWLESIEDRVRDMPEETLRNRGWKLIQGARRFNWKDTDMAMQTLKDLGIDPYQTKPKTPSMIRDEFGEEPIANLYETDFNKPSLVLLSKRGRPVGK